MALIFFDIDGTLWDENMQIPEGTIETLKQVQQNGHKIFLCSGRARGNIFWMWDLMEYWRRVVIMWNWMAKSCMKISFRRN